MTSHSHGTTGTAMHLVRSIRAFGVTAWCGYRVTDDRYTTIVGAETCKACRRNYEAYLRPKVEMEQ